jgi:hypothetical protein
MLISYVSDIYSYAIEFVRQYKRQSTLATPIKFENNSWFDLYAILR